LSPSRSPIKWRASPSRSCAARQALAQIRRDLDALPSGAYTCACRKAYRLTYRSQRETPRDRALSGAFALRPKGMHRRTFERAMERIDRAEGIVDGHKRKAIGHSNVRGYSGIRVAKSRTGAA
jgi:hypothetical protein